MLGAVHYPNNSVIQFDSIYHTGDQCHSLLCTTDLVPCCSASQGGNWYKVHMNGSLINVPTIPAGIGYYQSRENDGTLCLTCQRRTLATQSANMTLYCCQLPDSSMSVQTLCATIGMMYNKDEFNYNMTIPIRN